MILEEYDEFVVLLEANNGKELKDWMKIILPKLAVLTYPCRLWTKLKL